jgi:hypothetical protein
VEKIQRNVREWIVRRQHQDIKHATQMLHSKLLSGKGSRQQPCHMTNSDEHQKRPFDEKQAAIIIQRTVKKWLKTSQ